MEGVDYSWIEMSVNHDKVLKVKKESTYTHVQDAYLPLIWPNVPPVTTLK